MNATRNDKSEFGSTSTATASPSRSDNFRTANLTIKGSSKPAAAPCQDWALSLPLIHGVGLIVCDGVGSAANSEVGASLAGRITLENIVRFQPRPGRTHWTSFVAQIRTEWLELVSRFASDPREYNTTLHFAVIEPGAADIISLGDGFGAGLFTSGAEHAPPVGHDSALRPASSIAPTAESTDQRDVTQTSQPNADPDASQPLSQNQPPRRRKPIIGLKLRQDRKRDSITQNTDLPTEELADRCYLIAPPERPARGINTTDSLLSRRWEACIRIDTVRDAQLGGVLLSTDGLEDVSIRHDLTQSHPSLAPGVIDNMLRQFRDETISNQNELKRLIESDPVIMESKGDDIGIALATWH